MSKYDAMRAFVASMDKFVAMKAMGASSEDATDDTICEQAAAISALPITSTAPDDANKNNKPMWRCHYLIIRVISFGT